MKDEKEKAFNNWTHNKIHLTFPNGNSISTIWGYSSYTENYDMNGKDFSIDKFSIFAQSNDAEIMILKCPDKLKKKISKKYKTFEDDNVAGHIDILTWLGILNLLAK